MRFRFLKNKILQIKLPTPLFFSSVSLCLSQDKLMNFVSQVRGDVFLKFIQMLSYCICNSETCFFKQKIFLRYRKIYTYR